MSDIFPAAPRISRDGKLVLENGRNGLVLWDVAGLEAKAVPRVVATMDGYSVTALAASPDGETVVVGAGRRLLSLHAGQEARRREDFALTQGLGVSAQTNRWVAINAYGEFVTWIAGGNWDRQGRVGHLVQSPVTVAVAPNGEWFVCSSHDCRLELIQLQSNSDEWHVHLDSRRDAALSLTLSPDGVWLIAGDELWQILDGRATYRGRLSQVEHSERILESRFLASGELLTVHADAVIRRWGVTDTGTPNVLDSFTARVGEQARISSTCLSANGMWLAFTEQTGGDDNPEEHTFVMPTGGTYIAIPVNLPRSDNATLKAVDDSGSWVIASREGGCGLYPTGSVGDAVDPLSLGSTALFVSGGRSVVDEGDAGIIRLWPLDPPDIADEFAQTPRRS